MPSAGSHPPGGQESGCVFLSSRAAPIAACRVRRRPSRVGLSGPIGRAASLRTWRVTTGAVWRAARAASSLITIAPCSLEQNCQRFAVDLDRRCESGDLLKVRGARLRKDAADLYDFSINENREKAEPASLGGEFEQPSGFIHFFLVFFFLR